jgi:MoaA/NifB/PqqE/SkfB family radical SAM enzyme
MNVTEPFVLSLEADSRCQLKCPACPTAMLQDEFAKDTGALSLEDFKTVVDANPRIHTIELSNAGEIFLNKELPEIMEHAFDNGVRLTAHNGVNLNTASDRVLDATVRFGFRHLNIALDGVSQEVYSQYRVNGRIDRVLDHIRKIQDLKRYYHSPFPTLHWQFIVFGHNEHEIPKAREMAKSLGMSFNVKLPEDPDNFSPVRDEEWVRQVAGAVDRKEFLQRTRKHYIRGGCYMLWNAPQINWDGSIHGCYRVPNKTFSGNAFEQPLAEWYHSEDLQYARDMLMNKVPEDENSPCYECDLFKALSSSNNWITEEEIWANRQRLG